VVNIKRLMRSAWDLCRAFAIAASTNLASDDQV
jgi:hypothetical protein